jgi:NADP-dependent 3-hydroxy acid dehydrogenase YdfG
MDKIILVTGATSGFGKAIAQKFAAAGWHCILTGRRHKLLLDISTKLTEEYGIRTLPLCFDIRSRKQVTDALGSLQTEWRAIDVLVNNAGLALGRDSFENADMDDWDQMIDTNVKGLLYVSKAIIPFFISQRKGHVINIGSTAAKDVYRDGNVYCATKHAVDAISRAQRIDLLPYGIKVTAIHPGAAETEFSLVRYKGDIQKAEQVYRGYCPLTAEDIANTVFYCAHTPAHVCINELVITCTAQADNHYFHKAII